MNQDFCEMALYEKCLFINPSLLHQQIQKQRLTKFCEVD